MTATTRRPGGHPVPTGAPVQPIHLTMMALRVGHAAQDMVLAIRWPGQDSPQFRRASRTHRRRIEALHRLAIALARQPGVAS